MPIPVRLKRRAWTVALAGLFLFILILGYQGFGTILSAVVVAGWGLLLVTLYHLVVVIIDARAWQILLRYPAQPGFARLSFITWIGESVNSLLPVALIGGSLVRVRLLHQAGLPGALSGASVVVDVTAAVVSQILFSLLGLLLLLQYAVPGQSPGRILSGVVLFSLLGYGFYLAQKHGLILMFARRLERLGGATDTGFAAGAEALDRCIREMYSRPRAFWSACLVRLLGWLAGSGEVWLALYFLGHPVSLGEAILLESLGQAIRSAVFVVPGALGVQEGAYLVLALGLGMAPETGVALSLVKRVRELVLGLPGLMVWQNIEGKLLFSSPWKAR